ncbi:MAG: GNAT family N-acetyltransferase [Ginsengibacter sp.]
MNFSEATLDDISTLDKLINSAYRGEFSKKGWTSEADLLDGIRTDRASIEELIDTPGAVFLKCSNDENILQGCVFLEKNNDKMYVGMLTVSPTEQAKGIGKQLLAGAEKYATEQQCTTIEMTVISVRTELIAWYTKHG